jgi:hypothetical protein
MYSVFGSYLDNYLLKRKNIGLIAEDIVYVLYLLHRQAIYQRLKLMEYENTED